MHNNYSVFDITGPVLIGPSSSHTAGACRLANAARAIFNKEIEEAEIRLYGSFVTTLYGHGTDKALVGGLLGLAPDDERLVDALDIAREEGLAYRFVFDDAVLPYANVVRFNMCGESAPPMRVRGISVGGGNIIIDQINETNLRISLKYNTIVVDHLDKPGAVLKVSKILAEGSVNIAAMSMYRQGKHDRAYMIIEIDEDITEEMLEALRSIDDMYVISISKLY